MYHGRSLGLFLAGIFLFSVSCNSRKEKDPDIITSLFPVADIVSEAGKGAFSVDFVIPEGANPHLFEPTPSLVSRIRKAKIFVGVEPHLDGWMEKYLAPDAKKIYLSDAIPDAPNPHLWLSLENAGKITSHLFARLSELDPAKKEILEKNSSLYGKEIENLHAQLKEDFKPYKGTRIIQWHPAWDYMARDYDLIILDSIEKGHGDQPSLKKMKNLMERARKEKANLVIIGLEVNSPAAEILAREIHGSLVRVDGIGRKNDPSRNSYLKLMRYNADVLIQAMKENKK